MLKDEFIEVYKLIEKENNFTFKEFCELSKLSSSQLASILRYGGKRVSLDKMEAGLVNLGFYCGLKISDNEEVVIYE